MAKKPKKKRKSPTHILSVITAGVIVTFNEQRDKRYLATGEYEFFIADNPCNPSTQALHLVNGKEGWYVNKIYLDRLDHKCWSVSKITED